MKLTPSRGSAQCLPCGKKLFATREGAENRVEEIELRDASARKVPQRVYRCPNGGGWHLTSQSTQKRSSLRSTHAAMHRAGVRERELRSEPKHLRLLRETGLTAEQAAWAAELGYDLAALRDAPDQLRAA